MPKAEPSQSSLRDASSPEGGASWLLPVSTNKAPPEWNDFPRRGKMAKPERGTAGEQSESERVRFAGVSPIFSIDNRAKLAYITIVNTN